jgi:hypothetical protein
MLSAALVAARRRRWLIPALLLLGLGLRSYHYLRDRAVWQDEAGLLLTVNARNYHDLFLGRLDYHQAAPPLYLCALKTVSLFLGDSSRALRFPSFLASCAALLLFAGTARRMLNPRASPWAVLLFAVSEQLLWHASEAKAYSVDVLAAVVVLAVPYWSRLHSLQRQLLAYTLLTPLLLLSSYPACFLCVGVLLAYLPTVWSRQDGTTWLVYGVLAATTAAVLMWLLFGPVRSQHDDAIHSCWVACMPDWERPWTMPRWLLLSPLEVCRYCCKPLGQILVLFAVAGTRRMWQAGERTRVRLMLAPMALALAAACIHAYPFGGARVMVYAAPAIVLLAAAGVPPVLDWVMKGSFRSARARKVTRMVSDASQKRRPLSTLLRSVANPHHFRRHPLVRRRMVCAGLIVLLLVPAASSLVKVVRPWNEADISAVADYMGTQLRNKDLILGNDMAQQYYFRHLGSAFHLLDESPLPSPTGERLWVIMTAAVPRLEREQLASPLVPSGWRRRQQREFAFTTVLLFSR